jgi:tetratricopeptide (TPR) repeat protein
MAAAGKLTLSRRDFGILGGEFWGDLVVAEEVEVELEILGTRPNYVRWSFPSQGKPPAGEEVWKALETAGAAAAAARFRELRATQPEAYDFGAGQLALVVSRLMQRRRLEEALPLLAAGIEAYPDEPAFYTRSGEAHAGLGHREEAIAMYEKALSLDPDGTEAREMLRRLRPAGARASGR